MSYIGEAYVAATPTFEVVAKQEGDNYVGYVYLGVEIVWTLTEPTSKSPAGIEDFAGMTLRKFARRLAEAIA